MRVVLECVKTEVACQIHPTCLIMLSKHPSTSIHGGIGAESACSGPPGVGVVLNGSFCFDARAP